jgi:hypothetical protein
MRPGYRDPNRPGRKLPEAASAKLLQEYQNLMKTKLPEGQPPSGLAEDYDFMIVKHEVRLNGPCICGSEKSFEDCCGRGLAASHAT